jgi:hypothetical protein
MDILIALVFFGVGLGLIIFFAKKLVRAKKSVTTEQDKLIGADPDMAVLLSELSRYYDTTLWHVTSIWAAALGGLLVFSVQTGFAQ